jgi:putative ABC transport system permease protein
MFHSTWLDFRYTLRTLRKSPAFTLTAILSLALGIGANTTIFTVVNGVFLNPLPIEKASELISVHTLDSTPGTRSSNLLPMSYLNLKDLRDKNQVFTDLAGFSSPMAFGLSKGPAAVPERAFGELVTGNYFDVLGIRPALGRFFLPEEDSTPGTHPVVVLGNGIWQFRFGGDPNLVGQNLRVNSIVFTVVGIAPPGFKGVNAVFGPDLWIPTMMADQVFPSESRSMLRDRSNLTLRAAGRLKPGITRAKAEANLKTIASALEREYPESNQGRGVVLRPIADAAFTPGTREPAMFGGAVLMAIVGLVLLIACSNVANLLMARAAGRQQEVAVRLALGASRGRLIRQLLTESVVLALASGVAGIAIAREGIVMLNSFRPPEVARNLAEAQLDPAVFVFALLISVATGLIFGIVPALESTRPDISETLKQETRSAGRSRRRISFGNTLLAGQVAFSLVALITAGLCLRSIQHAYTIDPGFETRKLGLIIVNPSQAGYNQSRSEQFYREARERTSSVPGIVSMSWASNLPFWARPSRSIVIEGQEQREKANPVMTVVNTVDLNYFATLGIGLTEGRDFTGFDRAGTLPVAIVNETMAARFWPNQNPIGKRFQFSGDTFFRQVVGVVKTANYQSLGEPPQICVYVPLRQNFAGWMVLYARTEADPSTVLSALQRELRGIDPQVPIEDVRTAHKVIDQALWGAKLGVGLLSIFGFLALGLASIGLYGMMAYSVSRRKREIGLRMALGAEESRVLSLILRQGMQLVSIGVAIGIAASLLVGRALSTLLFGVSPLDPVSLGTASLVLILVALAACYLPARRASRVDPLVALRDA